jgi:hypothetical protein
VIKTYGFVADKVRWQILIRLPVDTTFEFRAGAVVVVTVAGAVVVAGEAAVVVGFAETVNEIDVAVAEACVPLAAIVAAIVHVPTATNVTRPDDASIVHTEVVELEYCFKPAPADAVEVIVGGVALSAYEPEYEPELIVSVRELAVISNEIALAFASALRPSAEIEAAIEHVPMLTKVTTPVVASIVQIPVVELEYDFVPLESVASSVDEVIVIGPALNS